MRSQYKTKADAEAAANKYDREALALRWALTDVMEDKIEWLKHKGAGGTFRIGVARLNAPHGGLILIPKREGMATAEVHYADEWLDFTRRAVLHLSMADASPEAHRARAMYELTHHVDAARRTACGAD